MPKALTVQRTLVIPPDRERFHERMLRKRDHYAQAKCRYWVVEEASLPGAFLEFFEAPTPRRSRARTKRRPSACSIPGASIPKWSSRRMPTRTISPTAAPGASFPPAASRAGIR